MRTEIPSWPEALFGDGDDDDDDDGRRFSEIDINVVTSTCLSKPMNRGRIVLIWIYRQKRFERLELQDNIFRILTLICEKPKIHLQ